MAGGQAILQPNLPSSSSSPLDPSLLCRSLPPHVQQDLARIRQLQRMQWEGRHASGYQWYSLPGDYIYTIVIPCGIASVTAFYMVKCWYILWSI